MLKLSFTGGSLSSYNRIKRKRNKLVSNAKDQWMTRVAPRSLERDAGRASKGLLDRMEDFPKLG